MSSWQNTSDTGNTGSNPVVCLMRVMARAQRDLRDLPLVMAYRYRYRIP